jgi:site-specific recombinase XerD
MQATYKFIFNRTGKVRADGTALIQVRITYMRQVRFVSTGIYVTPVQWSEKNQCVVKHANAIKINGNLADIKKRIQEYELDAMTRSVPLDIATIDINNNGTNVLGMSLAEFIMSETNRQSGLAIGTYNHIRSLCNIIGRSKLFPSIKSLTLANVQALDSLLLSEGKAVAYVNKRHQQLSKYAKLLHKRKFIAANPYDEFKRNKPAPAKRKFLSIEMLRELKSHAMVPRLESVRDMFLFSCYTGLAYKDVAKLTKADIITYDGVQFIIIDRTKTDEESAIPLLPQAAAIIDQYADADSDTLIPIISNQKFNGYLKEIQAICNIPINLTHHVARHTFATTMTLENGLSIETVSKMLGHRSIKTTQIYSKITRDRLARDMNGLGDIIDARMKE